MSVHVTPVRTKADRNAFVDLPFRLYAGDPNWVPPLKRDIHELIDPKRHPFHQHAQVELFLARDDGGRVVGRIAATRNDLYLQHHPDGAGFFGFFECERDPAIATALLDTAADWLAGQGLRVMRGPASFSLNEEAGLLVRGFDGPPVIMMSYNPPWYADLLEGYGFVKAKDLLAYYFDFKGAQRPPERLERAVDTLAKRHKITIRRMDKGRFWDEVARIRDFYNAALEKNWGHVPMTEAEFTYMAKQFKPVADFDLILFAEVDGELAGFGLGLPDLNVALRHMNGRLLPFGWAKALWYSRKIDRARILALGVLDKYRRTGAAELLYLDFFRAGLRKGVTKGEFSWVLEDNAPMRAAIEKMGAELYRVYRMYDKPLRDG